MNPTVRRAPRKPTGARRSGDGAQARSARCFEPVETLTDFVELPRGIDFGFQHHEGMLERSDFAFKLGTFAALLSPVASASLPRTDAKARAAAAPYA